MMISLSTTSSLGLPFTSLEAAMDARRDDAKGQHAPAAGLLGLAMPISPWAGRTPLIGAAFRAGARFLTAFAQECLATGYMGERMII